MKKILFIVLIVLLSVVGCTSTTPEKSTTANDPAEQPKQPEYFKIGDTVKMDKIDITLNSVHLDKGSEFMKPESGKKWVVFDATVKNNSQETVAMSSILMFKAVDSKGYSGEMSIGADTKGSLDGELGPGRVMSGQLAYEFDTAEKNLEFIFEPNVFGTGQAIYRVTIE